MNRANGLGVRRWVAAWMLPLAVVLVGLGGLWAGEEAAPGGGLKAGDYVTVAELRIPQVKNTLTNLKSFLDLSVPIGSLQAVYFTKLYMLHSTNLAGIDGDRAAHLAVYAPKGLLTATDEQVPGLLRDSAVAQLVPVKDEAAFLAQMKNDAEQVADQGPYQMVMFKDLPFPVLFKLQKGYAVFSLMPMGMELGLAQVEATAAEDAASKEAPGLILEFKPRALFAAAGVEDDNKRQAAIAIFSLVLEELNRTVSREMRRVPMEPETAQFLATQAVDGGREVERLQLYVTFEKAACSPGFRVEAREGSNLDKLFAGMQPLDMNRLCGAQGTRTIINAAGTVDPVCMAGLQGVYAEMPPQAHQMLAPILAGLKDLPGHAVSYAIGFDDQNLLAAAAELDFDAKTDMGAVQKSLEALVTTASGISEAQGGYGAELTSAPGGEQDGWKVTLLKLELKSTRPNLQRKLTDPQQRLFVNPISCCLLTKDGRLVLGTGPNDDAARLRATAYAKHEAAGGLNPEFTQRVASYCRDRGAISMTLVSPYPVVNAMVERGKVDPFLKAALHAMAEVNPFLIAQFHQGHAAQMEVLLEPDNLKQWVVAAIAIPNLMVSRRAANETAAIQNLKALATAQAQFIKRNDFYASNANALNANGTLIAADLKNAFEDHLKNGDQDNPTPKAGYVFRMLQGDSDEDKQSFLREAGKPEEGMNTWAIIARPVEPGVTGDYQFYISEAGTVYQMEATTDKNDPFYKRFLLDRAPTWEEVEKLGWKVAR